MSDRSRSALLVMADSAERRRAEQILRATGLDTVAVDHPMDALAMQRSFDLVVLSIEGLDAHDRRFLELLGRTTPHIRVLLLVPEGQRLDALRLVDAPGQDQPYADAILPLPFFEDELRMVVKSLLRWEAADPLTGLANRPAHERALAREVSRAKRDGAALALGLFDVDDFRRANDELGYSNANLVLIGVARSIKSEFRVNDLVARWGGEEFVVLATGLPGDEDGAWKRACLVFERARETVARQPVMVVGREYPVTVSGGLALFPFDTPGFQDAAHLDADECAAAGRRLFDLANERLKTAKREGKNRICPCTESGHGLD